MQYYTYQLNDGTEDVGPYHRYNNYNWVAIYNNESNDAMIMRARCNASARGASPVEIEAMVAELSIGWDGN